MNPLQGSGVSDRSRCGAVPILELADEPSTGIACGAVPCESLILCGDRACRIADEPSAGIGGIGRVGSGALAVVPCSPILRGSGVSERSRCGAVRILELAGEPSAGIGRVGSLAGEPSAGIGVVPCESLSSPMNEPSAGIGRVGALSLWCRANP